MAPPPPQRAGVSQLLQAGPPANAATGTRCLRFQPRHTPSRRPGAKLHHLHRPNSIDARLLTFRAKAADQAHAACTPGTTWPVHGTPARLIPGEFSGPPVSMPPKTYDASTTTPDNKPDALERLPGPHLTRSSHAFSLTLTTTVFSQRSSRRFDAYPRGSTPKGQQSFISRTAPLQRVSLHDISFLRS